MRVDDLAEQPLPPAGVDVVAGGGAEDRVQLLAAEHVDRHRAGRRAEDREAGAGRDRRRVALARLLRRRPLQQRLERAALRVVGRHEPRHLGQPAVPQQVDADRPLRHAGVGDRARDALAALVADPLAGAAAGRHDRHDERDQDGPHASSRAVWTGAGRAVTAPGMPQQRHRAVVVVEVERGADDARLAAADGEAETGAAAAFGPRQREPLAGVRQELPEAVAVVAHLDQRVAAVRQRRAPGPAAGRAGGRCRAGSRRSAPRGASRSARRARAARRPRRRAAAGGRRRAPAAPGRTGRAAASRPTRAASPRAGPRPAPPAPRRARAPCPAARDSSSSAAAATSPVTGVRSSCATSLENRFSRSADSSSSPSLRDSASAISSSARPSCAISSCPRGLRRASRSPAASRRARVT